MHINVVLVDMQWQDLHVNWIVIGAVFLLWAHLIFLLFCSSSWMTTRRYVLRIPSDGPPSIDGHSNLDKQPAFALADVGADGT